MNMPVSSLKGVGKAREEALAKLGVKTVRDLLYLYPRSYEDRGNIRLLADSVDGEKQSFCLTVATEPKTARINRGMSLLKFRAYDESGSAEITYFNQDYLKPSFKLGESYRFYGKIEHKKTSSGVRHLMSSPSFEPMPPAGAPALSPLVPVYPLSAGLTRKFVTSLVMTAIKLCSVPGVNGEDTDIIPPEIRERNGLCTSAFALREIHCPGSLASLAAAKKRLVFEELFCFSLGVLSFGKKMRVLGAPRCGEGDISSLTAQLTYALTGAQVRAIDDIRSDMASETPMCRLLVGDVGCGKTVCAAAALFIAVKSGYQAALMAPTEILASQHYNDLEPLFSALGIRVKLLTGALSPAKKREVYASLADENKQTRTDIVIGTHALISEGVKFSSLALVVTDEQHRFGVAQRSALSAKGDRVHMLVMSATPIPRSLALTLYGDLSLSAIGEMPPGRQRVDTYVVDEGYRERIIKFMHKLTSDGGRVYVVCPAVEDKKETDEEEGDIDFSDIGAPHKDAEEEKPPMKSAVSYASELQKALPDRRVAFVHGKLKSAEKNEVMQAFASGKTDILVSTTVIEVGVNVPQACLMVVENAERFGLSQLHQLRGRVGRGTRKSYCILVSDAKGEAARARLEAMKTMYDGFAIAEKDLEMRGPGDFIKSSDTTRQSGAPRFRLADLCTDAKMLEDASKEAKALLETDPELLRHAPLRESVIKQFEKITEA